MPIEIRELIIRTTIVNNADSDQGGARLSPAPEDDQAIINACVDQVLKILARKRER